MPLVGTAQRIQQGARPFSAPLALPAPMKGWNTRDELDAMDPMDAITLDNFYPDYSGVNVRNGYASYATGLGASAVETLAQYLAGSGNKFLGACSGAIYDISSSGAVGAALGTGFSSNRWQTVNFLSKMFLANGADTMKVYDGSSLADSTFSGVTLSTLIGCFAYQQRLFFWASNSTGFWYAPLNSITGALTFYDLAPFCPRGANLLAMTSVTHDGGNGVLDYIAFIMTTGEMLLYYGNDPSNVNAWQLIGQYRVASPVNIRAICQYGGDSFCTTYDDYLPIQQQLVALKVGQLPPRSKVSGALQIAINDNKNGFGWQSLYYPAGRRLIFNVPNVDGTFDQHVCNTSLPTQPWCRFTGMNASCWGLFGDGLYFGGAGGIVYKADTGTLDDGSPISATAQQAWNKGNSAYRKRMTAVRPIVQSGQGTYTFTVGFDYNSLELDSPPTVNGIAITDDFDTSITDDNGVAITAGVPGIVTSWAATGGSGTAFSFGMSLFSAASTSWLRTDYRMEQGIAL